MIKTLIKNALAAQQYSYSPYSGFCVGAALLSTDGRIFTGCNVENAAFSPTICAERTAVVKAISENAHDFAMIAIVGKKLCAFPKEIDFVSPCGVCRQVLAEFCNADFKIILARSVDDYKVVTLGELLPLSFSPTNLE